MEKKTIHYTEPAIAPQKVTIVSVMEDMDKRLRYLEEPYLHYRDIHIQQEQEKQSQTKIN